jgi:hypothetical protein
MAIIAYSSLYALSTDGRTYLPETAPVNQRLGDSIWINATVIVPASTAIASTFVIAPVAAGVRPVRAWFTNPQANAALTCDVGYTSSVAAISSGNAFATTATTVSLTDAQLSAITVLPVDGDNLVLTTRAAIVTTVATWKVFIEFVNTGI